MAANEEQRMADKKPEQTTPETPKSKLPVKSIVILLVIVLAEAGIFMAWTSMSRPRAAEAAVKEPVVTQKVEPTVEFQVAPQFTAPYLRQGRLIVYDLEVSIVCDSKDEKIVKETCEKHSGYIRDQIRTIVAKSEPQYFEEVTLDTLKRQIGVMLEGVLGEDVVKKVLIPRCMPYKPGA
jgi:flagellar basal body-associated protein FliL